MRWCSMMILELDVLRCWRSATFRSLTVSRNTHCRTSMCMWNVDENNNRRQKRRCRPKWWLLCGHNYCIRKSNYSVSSSETQFVFSFMLFSYYYGYDCRIRQKMRTKSINQTSIIFILSSVRIVLFFRGGCYFSKLQHDVQQLHTDAGNSTDAIMMGLPAGKPWCANANHRPGPDPTCNQ